jgi:hypothetical protein
MRADADVNTDINQSETIVVEKGIPFFLANCPVTAIRDDYYFWRGHGYRPQAGKPLYIDGSNPSVHHIFFDDNIVSSAPSFLPSST